MDSSGGRPSPKASQRTTNDLAHRYFMQASSVCYLLYRNLMAGETVKANWVCSPLQGDEPLQLCRPRKDDSA